MPDPDFRDAVLEVVSRIPSGRVLCYGDIAWILGTNAPRAVGRVMALYGEGSPWWRVVPVSGHPPQGHASLALPHYLREGTPLRTPKTAADHDDYRIALHAARLDVDWMSRERQRYVEVLR